MAKRKKYGYDVMGSMSSPPSSLGGSNPAFQSITHPRGGGAAQAPSFEPFHPTTPAYQEGGISAGTPTPSPVGPPMPSVDTQEQRRVAREGFSFDMGDVNRRLMEAAMNYGNAPKVTQYGLDPSGLDTSSLADVTANPNSVWANIGRYSKQHDRGINEDLNNRGSFFSGANLTQHRDLNDDVSRQQGQAALDFSGAEADLLSTILRSRGARDDALRSADLQDIAAAAASQPVGDAGLAPVAPYDGGPGGPPYVYDPGSPQDSFGLNIPYTPLPFPRAVPSGGGGDSTAGAGALGGIAGSTAHRRRRR